MKKNILVALLLGAIVISLSMFSGCIDNGDEVEPIIFESYLFENYSQTSHIHKAIYDVYATGQTFTPKDSHSITKVVLYVSKVGAPVGDITVSIRETIEKYPGIWVANDVDLISVSLPAINLSDTIPERTNFTFDDELILNDNITYAIVVACPTADTMNHPRWLRIIGKGAYDGGMAIGSSNNGKTWSPIYADDYLFEEWGILV